MKSIEKLSPGFSGDLRSIGKDLSVIARSMQKSVHDPKCKRIKASTMTCPQGHMPCKSKLDGATAMTWVLASRLQWAGNTIGNLGGIIEFYYQKPSLAFIKRMRRVVEVDLERLQFAMDMSRQALSYHTGKYRRMRTATEEADVVLRRVICDFQGKIEDMVSLHGSEVKRSRAKK